MLQQNVLTEIEVMRMVNHPNILQLIEVYESSKYIHLLMPLIKGGMLFDVINHRVSLKESDARSIMLPFLSALEHLHQKLIVHRDLKPENLLLASNSDLSDIKIADFGLAEIIESPDSTLDLLCGSPGYIAPEILDKKPYNYKVDMFSAGAIFYAIITGE